MQLGIEIKKNILTFGHGEKTFWLFSWITIKHFFKVQAEDLSVYFVILAMSNLTLVPAV